MNRIEAGFGVVVGVIAVGAMAALASVAGAGGAPDAEGAVQTVVATSPAPRGDGSAADGSGSVSAAGAVIDSADAALAVVRPLEGPGVDAGSERAVLVSAESVYGAGGSLRAAGVQLADPPALAPDAPLWLVGFTGEIPAPYGVAPLTLDHLVMTIDASTGLVLSNAGGDGGLPAVFDDAG